MKIDISKYAKMSPFEVKNELCRVAEEASHGSSHTKKIIHAVLNAGRGNPNFLNVTAREAFAYLTLFSVKEAGEYHHYVDLGLIPKKEGIAKRFFSFIKTYQATPAGKFLKEAIEFAVRKFSFDEEDFILELVGATLGDYYPEPPRILYHTEIVARSYMERILCGSRKPPKGRFDLFATEGATAAMIYLFKSLKYNRIINEKDKIAIITPIFSPYLEIPALREHNLVEILVEGKESMDWQIPQEELDKIKNPSVKALYMVNPTNPTSVALKDETIKRIAHIVKTERKDLIVVTDTVYATFVDQFHSLIEEIPENLVCVYSYSKYFGVTGWRLGLIMLYENNILDQKIQGFSEKIKKELASTYKIVSPDPDHLPFIDRLVADSRDSALAHTAGLSCPQQSMMTLFSLFELMDDSHHYKKAVHKTLKDRIDLLYRNLGLKIPPEKGHAYYYTLIDLLLIAEELYGPDFSRYLGKNHTLLGVLFDLAHDYTTVCLPGEGFKGPVWSLRVSLANLEDSVYVTIGKNIRALLDKYYQQFKGKTH